MAFGLRFRSLRMRQPPSYRSPTLLDPQAWRRRWLILGMTAMTFLAAMGIGLAWLKSRLHAKLGGTVARAEALLGMPISADRLNFGFGTAQIFGVAVGEPGAFSFREVAINLHMNPLSPNFGRPHTTKIISARINLSVPQLQQWALQMNQAVSINEATNEGATPVTKPPDGESSVELEAGGPFADFGALRLRDVDVRLADEKGEVLADCESCNATWDGRQGLFKGKGKISLPGFGITAQRSQWMARWDPKQSHWLLNATLQDANDRTTVQLKGTVDPMGESAELAIGAEPLHALFASPWRERLQSYAARINSRIKVRREGTGWLVDGRLTLRDLSLNLPLVASDVTGPVSVHGKMQVRLRQESGQWRFEAGSQWALDRKDSKQNTGATPLQARLRATGGLGVGAPLELSLLVPETPCAALHSLPKSMMTGLQDVRWEGTFGGHWRTSMQAGDWSSLRIPSPDMYFRCSMADAPEEFSPTRLQSTRALRRRSDGSYTLSLRPGEQGQHFVALPGIAPSMIAAVVVSEDHGFWRHNGFVFGQMTEALRQNLVTGAVVLGGSTISMQTAKNLFLSGERSLSRKLQEAILTHHLERLLSKERIMEIYLNIIEFGPQIYGLRRAAHLYFGKAPHELNALESTYLASLLPSPKSRFRHICHGRLTKDSRKLLYSRLRAMRDSHFISDSDYERSRLQELQFAPLTPELDSACQLAMSQSKRLSTRGATN